MLDKISILAWLDKYSIKVETGDPYDLTKDHFFWFDIIRDLHPRQVWYKAAQVGGTTAAILKMFWLVKNAKMNCIYTMPRSSDVTDFVNGKVNPIIKNNEILQEYVKDQDSIQQKRVGNNSIYFRGTITSREALSVPSDLNIHDEYDRSDQMVVSQYRSRQGHSKHSFRWYFSNPSVKGNGVSKYWEVSDKRHWIIECDSCSKEQYLSWPDSICQEREIFVCKYCDKELSDMNRAKGTWRAAVKGETDYRGYWINQLMAPWRSAKDILDEWRDPEQDEEYFYNFVLGLPYVGSGATVEENDIFQNLTSGEHDEVYPMCIGVDTGTTIYHTVMNSQGVFDYGKCDDYKEVERLLKKYPKSIAVFDAQGDLQEPRRLVEKYKGRIFLCFYRRDRKTMQVIKWGEKDKRQEVIVDRNRMLQMCIDEFKSEMIPIFGTKTKWWDWWLHWNNIYRITEENSMGIPEKKWERSGPDHWVHSYLYARVGMEKYGSGDIGGFIVEPEDKTLPFETHKGTNDIII